MALPRVSASEASSSIPRGLPEEPFIFGIKLFVLSDEATLLVKLFDTHPINNSLNNSQRLNLGINRGATITLANLV